MLLTSNTFKMKSFIFIVAFVTIQTNCERVCDSTAARDAISKGCPPGQRCQFPNPEDCQSYIQCESNGNESPIQYEKRCPNGLYWNDFTFTCEQREYSTCRDNDYDDNDDNDDLIYRQCNHRSRFTERELEIAKQYFQNAYANAAIPPQRPPCQRMRIRRDFKCMTHEERMKFINTYKQLYLNDSLINKMAELHSRYWPAWHKSAEIFPTHHQQSVILEDALARISGDPGMTIPYWDCFNEGLRPKRSMIWDYIGRAGNANNGYCVNGGRMDDVRITREQRCVRREWNRDGTILNWYPPEYYTSISQRDFPTFISELYNSHFKIHMWPSGYNGDVSVRQAPYDLMFFMIHHAQYNQLMQRQMQENATVIPFYFENFGKINLETGVFTAPWSFLNKMSYFSNQTIVELWQYGYGGMCSITDKMVEWALYETSGTRPPLPRAVQRLRESLSPERFAFWFPAFAAGNYTRLHIDMFEVGNRNRGPNCRRLPRVLNFNETDNSRRQYENFIYDGEVDISPYIDIGQQLGADFIAELNSVGYCSPYN